MSASPVASAKRLHNWLRAGAQPPPSAPNRLLVGRHSVLTVRHLSLLVPRPRAKLLLHSRRASRGGTCEVT